MQIPGACHDVPASFLRGIQGELEQILIVRLELYLTGI